MKAWLVSLPDSDSTASGEYWSTGYVFDDRTPHHRLIAVGDLFFFRTSARLIAVARISEIAREKAQRSTIKCPICGTGEIVERTQQNPRFRCLFAHEFVDAIDEVREVTSYRVRFGRDHSRTVAEVIPEELRAFELTNSPQLSIRPCDLSGLVGFLARRDHTIVGLIRSWTLGRPFSLPDHEADTSDFGTFLDEIERLTTGIRLRRGDEQFREMLFAKYGERCMISGCEITGLIEAAYILPRTRFKLARPGNGILLRSDLHTLFDLNLIGIQPTQLWIRTHPSLNGTEYERFAGVKLNKGNGKGPSQRALELRWQDFRSHARPARPAGNSPEAPDRIGMADTKEWEGGVQPP